MSQIPVPSSDALRSGIASRIVIVTGAASGIGLATAQLFAQHGGRVVLVDLSEPRLRAAADEVGHGALFYACDVSSWTAQLGLFGWVLRELGAAPDIVCLNAGVDPELAIAGNADTAAVAKQNVNLNYLADEYLEVSSTGESPSKSTSSALRQPSDLVHDVNVKGVVYGVKLAVHYMSAASGRQFGGGRIIITGSAASYVPFANQDLYQSSKHAVLGLVRSTSRRAEIVQKRIGIAMVAPWLTSTAMTAELGVDATAGSEASTPLDVALGIGYLASHERVEAVQGRCIWVRGKRLIEVESSYEKWLRELMKI